MKIIEAKPYDVMRRCLDLQKRPASKPITIEIPAGMAADISRMRAELYATMQEMASVVAAMPKPHKTGTARQERIARTPYSSGGMLTAGETHATPGGVSR